MHTIVIRAFVNEFEKIANEQSKEHFATVATGTGGALLGLKAGMEYSKPDTSILGKESWNMLTETSKSGKALLVGTGLGAASALTALHMYRKHKNGIKKEAEKQHELGPGAGVVRDLTAGAIAGGVSGLAVTPISTVSDILSTNARDEKSIFHNMKARQVVEHLYQEGANAAKALGKNKIIGGIKHFYGGSGLKTVKIAPQNAIGMALFTGITAAINHAAAKKKEA